MDAARIAAIWTELKEYGDETQLGFPLSTIKVGEVCQLISDIAVLADTIERQAKERADFREQLRDTQGRLWSVKCSRDDARSQRDALKAEVERLSAALEARTDDLQALKIEHAVVLASSRCQLCGERVEPPRSFCSTCCAR